MNQDDKLESFFEELDNTDYDDVLKRIKRIARACRLPLLTKAEIKEKNMDVYIQIIYTAEAIISDITKHNEQFSPEEFTNTLGQIILTMYKAKIKKFFVHYCSNTPEENEELYYKLTNEMSLLEEVLNKDEFSEEQKMLSKIGNIDYTKLY